MEMDFKIRISIKQLQIFIFIYLFIFFFFASGCPTSTYSQKSYFISRNVLWKEIR